MIDSKVVDLVKSAVCAVGYIEVELEQFVEEPYEPNFTVYGTGFLIDETSVLTNRHVLTKMRESMTRNHVDDAKRFVQFVEKIDRGWRSSFVHVESMHILPDPGMDIGLIRLGDEIEDMDPRPLPLLIQDLSKFELSVGKNVGACGYAHGHELLERDGKIYRFGPVLQQGHISAMAPHDASGRIDEFLLDMRVTVGMSGSPVFLPESGVVIGMVYEKSEALSGFAVPLTPAAVEALLEAQKIAENEEQGKLQ